MVIKDTRTNRIRITRIVEGFRNTHPEWFQMYALGKRGTIREFYSPELIEQIKKDLGITSEENH